MSPFCILKYLIAIDSISEIGGSTFVTYKNDMYGQITSPGYPGNYPNNANYTWIIRTGHRRAKVEIRIEFMDIHEWNPCDDYLLITETDPCCFTAFKRCGKQARTVYVRGMEIQVSFISDHDGLTAKGFDLTWTVTLPATTALPKTTLIAAKKVDLTSTTPITTTTTPRRNVLTTQLLYTSSTNPIRSTALRENLKSTTLLHVSTSTKPIRTTARTENIKTTTLLHEPQTSQTSTHGQGQTLAMRTTTSVTKTTPIPTTTLSTLQTTLMERTSQPSILASTTTDIETTTIFITYSTQSQTTTQAHSVTTPNNATSTEGSDTSLQPTEIMYLVLGISLAEFALIASGICIIKRLQNEPSKQANRDIQVDNVRPISRKSVMSLANVYESIPLEHFSRDDIMEEDEERGMYVDLPDHVYDRLFVKRTRVNENTNFYALITELKNKKA